MITKKIPRGQKWAKTDKNREKQTETKRNGQ